MTTESLLDDAIIAEMRDMLGDDTYRGFVLRMLDEVVDLQPALESILATQDYELLARTAHKTAGSVVSVGAKGLHALLKQIEDTAREPGQQSQLPALVGSLPARLEETRSHLGLAIGAL